ncbi:FadR/GntR family transcriptional regulator [Cetobacterium sp.]|uniref:FadR/GntR family transcriptional regulator n=1 Tax=Cetobacterium sp. TaxID=2071632 RepID=UPI003EE545E9
MNKEKASDKVFKYIEEKIVKGIWKEGDKIESENQLAIELNVSRVSVREAISKMVAMGILLKKKGGGSFVKGLTAINFMDNLIPFMILGDGDYIEILEMRSALDTVGVGLFIKNADDETIKELDKINKNLNEKDITPDKFFEQDMIFHRFIMKNCGNSLIYKTFEMLLNIMGYHAKEQYFKLPLKDRILEHDLITDAIKKKDLEIAQIYMKRHLERTIFDLKK